MAGCESFLEVGAPEHRIVSETVFNNDQTAIGAMQGIYNQLFRASYTGGGRETSIHVLAGLASDELKSIRENDQSLTEFYENTILPNNTRNLSIWTSAYNIIYMCNSLLEGIETSEGISENVRIDLEGEAKFIRAFTYFYLLNLYDDIPLVLSTAYQENALVSRIPVDEVYEQIITDLTDASNLLGDAYRNNDRTSVNRFVAMAFFARVHLFLGNYSQAASLSTEVIERSSQYEILDNLDQVFLANSDEAIWQISPIGNGGVVTYTNEGTTFIFHPSYPSLTRVALTEDLVNTFEEEDIRRQNWIGFNENTGYNFAYKYKDRSSFNNITEYSMVLRLAEQYLIRAEARALSGNLSGAIADINVIRNRAGASLLLSALSSEINQNELLNIILEERRKELFTEWGHRWFDLKRTQNANIVLNDKTNTWEETDLFFPIPAEERMKNPNLTQNAGY
tara:strand:- start:71383 stop:72738 length:1356 start_codon:yes stop_codon:yes gene_type:complete